MPRRDDLDQLCSGCGFAQSIARLYVHCAAYGRWVPPLGLVFDSVVCA